MISQNGKIYQNVRLLAGWVEKNNQENVKVRLRIVLAKQRDGQFVKFDHVQSGRNGLNGVVVQRPVEMVLSPEQEVAQKTRA